jgi:hypothetical protein
MVDTRSKGHNLSLTSNRKRGGVQKEIAAPFTGSNPVLTTKSCLFWNMI